MSDNVIGNIAPSKKLFPLDIFAVKQYGLEKWQREFFWPVSDEEFESLCLDIETSWERLVNDQPKEIADILIVARALLSEYWHFLHALQVIERIKKTGMEPMCSDKTLWYGNILAEEFKEKGENFFKKLLSTDNKITQENFIKKYLRKFKRSVRCIGYNLSLIKLRSLIENKEHMEVYGVPPFWPRQYMKRSPNWVSITFQQDWLSKDNMFDISIDQEDGLKSIAEAVVENLKNIATKHRILLNNEHINYLKQFTFFHLKNTLLVVLAVRRYIKKHSNVHLLIPSSGNSFQRVLAIVVRENGGKVTSFTHGGNIGLFGHSIFAASEFAISDEFMTYTSASADLFKKIRDAHQPLRGNKVEVVSVDTDMYFKMWKKMQKDSLPKVIKTVMVIGHPHNQWRYSGASAAFSLTRLDFELRIIDALKSAGYDVLYKPHPERMVEIKGIFENKAEVVEGHFQDKMQLAEAFIFGNIRTTAFQFAMFTKKPIISFLIPEERARAFPEALELLEKRCKFIPTHIDERQRIIFDEKKLLEILAKRPETPNMEFVEKYMFP